MEMHQIRYFLAVSRTLNFTRAAEECNVSQPALTRAIHSLEAELGGQLLTRERMLSHLTELGQRMLPLMQQCYESAQSARSLARAVKNGETTLLSIAISRTVNVALLAGRLAELCRVYPGVQLRVNRSSAQEAAESLKKGEAELAIAGPLGEVWERLDKWSLFSEPFELIVSHEHKLAGHNMVEFDQIAGEQLLLQADCEMAKELSTRLSGHGIEAASAHRVTTDHDLIALVEANLGISIVPASAAKSERLRCVPLKGLDLNRTVAVYGAAGRRRSLVATTMLNLLRAADWSRYVH